MNDNKKKAFWLVVLIVGAVFVGIAIGRALKAPQGTPMFVMNGGAGIKGTNCGFQQTTSTASFGSSSPGDCVITIPQGQRLVFVAEVK